MEDVLSGIFETGLFAHAPRQGLEGDAAEDADEVAVEGTLGVGGVDVVGQTPDEDEERLLQEVVRVERGEAARGEGAQGGRVAGDELVPAGRLRAGTDGGDEPRGCLGELGGHSCWWQSDFLYEQEQYSRFHQDPALRKSPPTGGTQFIASAVPSTYGRRPQRTVKISRIRSDLILEIPPPP